MWTVVYMAQSLETVEKVRTLLRNGRILTKIRALEKSDKACCCYEILVPAAEIPQAHDLILEYEL